MTLIKKDESKFQLNITKLIKKLDYLQFVSNEPSMYLKKFFGKLKLLIELEELNTLRKNDFLKRVGEFEHYCLSNLREDTTRNELNKQVEDLKGYFNQITTKNRKDLDDDTTSQVQSISDDIYDEIYKRKKRLFQDRTILFISRYNLASKRNTNKLVIINNAYYGKRITRLFKRYVLENYLKMNFLNFF